MSLGAGGGAAGGGAESGEALTKQRFLDSWSDALTNTRCHSACMALADVDGMGEVKLLAASEDKKLRVFAGADLKSEHFLLEEPVAVVAFYTDDKRPRMPAVAVAGGPHVFIYRNMRPYFKFALEPTAIDDDERALWRDIASDKVAIPEALEKLHEMQDGGVDLTYRSVQFMSMEDDPDSAERFAVAAARRELKQQSVITCMSSIAKNSEAPGAIGCLVIGTENCEVLILSTSGASIVKRCKLPSPPVKMVVSGMLDVDYRILVACRDACVYTLRNLDSISAMKLEVSGMKITLEAQVVGLTTVGRQAIVGCTDNSIHCYHIKGKKLWSMYMPARIVAMEHIEVATVSVVKAFVVALETGELRVYNDKKLILVHAATKSPNPDKVLGMAYGSFAREDRCLVMSHVSGALSVKIVPRKTDFNITTHGGPPPEQDIPLKIPKKTRLYVEQTQREREQATVMHRVFQRQLCKLRLDTARAYVQMITDGRGPSTYMAGVNVRINVAVMGLGPSFTLKVTLHNSGTRAITGLSLTYMYSGALYLLRKPFQVVPVLLPSLVYEFHVPVECVNPAGGSDQIRVVLLRPDQAVPALSAVVDMPVSLPPETEAA